MKPITLKWRKYELRAYLARTPVGCFDIYKPTNKDYWAWRYNSENTGESPTLDQAKADAQAAWDKLIMSCLEQ